MDRSPESAHRAQALEHTIEVGCWPRLCFRQGDGTGIVSPWCNMAQLIELPLNGTASTLRQSQSHADESVAEVDLEDLIYSWQRLGNPALRRLAIRLIRTLEEDSPGEKLVCRET